MAQPRVLILRAPGTNCDEETAHAFSLAGALAERWHVNRVLESPGRLAEFQVLALPGGFSYGDDIAAGRILGNQIQHHLADVLEAFRASGKLILGICNGFQVLLKTKLLAAPDDRRPSATLTLNNSGRFEARWVRLGVQPGRCVFLQGIETMELPVAHAEGRFVARNADVFQSMEAAGQLVLRYLPHECAKSLSQNHRGLAHFAESSQQNVPVPLSADGSGIGAKPQAAVGYPDNPNGAMGDVAGICDATGRVLGLMPHPERFVDPMQHPRWTREPARESGDGRRVFQNAVRYFT